MGRTIERIRRKKKVILSGPDFLIGRGSEDELYGGRGDDSLEGNVGDDYLNGGKVRTYSMEASATIS